jgi:RNA polymerase sigma-70 factor, ECF subfamily
VSASLMQSLTLSHLETARVPDLVTVVAARDAAALGQVYEEHHGALCSFCQRLLGDRAAAEDLAHDVFVRLPELIHKLEAGRSLRAFLFAIAAHRAKHYLRAAARRRKLAERFALEPNATVARPDHIAEQRWITSQIALALESLPREQQAAFVLAELEGQDAATIASRLHIPEATARTRLFHARRKLRALLGAWGLVAVFVASAALAASHPAVRGAVASLLRGVFGSAPSAPRTPTQTRSWVVPPSQAAPPPVAASPNLTAPSAATKAAEPAPIAIEALPELPKRNRAPQTRSTKPSPLPAPQAVDTIDPSLEAYRAAHRTHFDGADPVASLNAWDQYLADFPAGSFATDARFNRALCLIRVGRHAEARAALEPFANAPAGSYRQAEATSLLQGLTPPPAAGRSPVSGAQPRDPRDR